MSFANTNKALGAGALLLVGAIVPGIAHAGLGDFFGVAGAVTAITDVTWKIYLVDFTPPPAEEPAIVSKLKKT